MIRYSTLWALNASKSCFRSSGRVIGYSLESVGCGSCIPHSSKPFAHRTAPPITVDLSLLFLMAGESADCFICVHEACPHFHYIPFLISTKSEGPRLSIRGLRLLGIRSAGRRLRN